MRQPKATGFTIIVDTQRATPLVIFTLMLAAAAVCGVLAIGCVQ